MARIAAGLCLLLSPLAYGAETSTATFRQPRFEAQAGLGAGWEDNLNNAYREADQADGVFGRAQASIGLATSVARSRLSISGRFAHTAYPDFSDLDNDAFGGIAGVLVPIGDRLALAATSRVQSRAFVDERRDALDLGAGAALRIRVTDRVSTRIGATYLDSDASDSIFSRWSRGASGGIEFRLPAEVYLGAEYAWSEGSDYSYEESTGTMLVPEGMGGPGERRGGETDTFGGTQIAVKGEAVTQQVFLDLDRSFGDHVVGRVGYVHTRVDGDLLEYQANGVSGSLSVRF